MLPPGAGYNRLVLRGIPLEQQAEEPAPRVAERRWGRWALIVGVAFALACALHAAGVGGSHESQQPTWTSRPEAALSLHELRPGDDKAELAEARSVIRQLEVRTAQLEKQLREQSAASSASGSSASGSSSRDCSDGCVSMSKQGRWRFGPHGHFCPDPLSGKLFCHCSHELSWDTACMEKSRAGVAKRRLRSQPGGLSIAGEADPPDLMDTVATEVALEPMEAIGDSIPHLRPNGSLAGLRLRSVESPAEVVGRRKLREEEPPCDGLGVCSTLHTFCNASGLAGMSGQDLHQAEQGSMRQLESSILSDVVREMENNNVDQVARDIFTFYMCVRWVPDDTFWSLAKHEMASNMIASVIDEKKKPHHAIAELYQNYKFVPLLCSENIKVYDQQDAEDNTYFRHFEKTVAGVTSWIKEHEEDEVARKLNKVDRIFCEDAPMNSRGCTSGIAFDEWMNGATSGMGDWAWNKDTFADRFDMMFNVFQSFSADNANTSHSFRKLLRDWKAQFPFHSFVHKNDGMPPSDSPAADQRFLVCFGNRVASDLHRRPTGRHILADQNNIGCHGFWAIGEVKKMLTRMVELWKPPTCQLAEMSFLMKKQILSMFQKMNERLFDALPSLMMDEGLSEDGMLDQIIAGPQPFDPQNIAHDGEVFVGGMRVQSTQEVRHPKQCKRGDSVVESFIKKDAPICSFRADAGVLGHIAIRNGSLGVLWDGADLAMHEKADSLRIVPRWWEKSATVYDRAADLVSGVGQVVDATGQLLHSMGAGSRYKQLANLMSNSTSKWVICPLRRDIDLAELDSKIGVEDAAFKDQQMEAYAKWTGYEAALPGEQCEQAGFDTAPFAVDAGRVQICEISELHADHVEKYTLTNGSLEQFLCPTKPSLPAASQLRVLQEKEGQCYLHMTGNQQRQYQWAYNGAFPNRRQFDRKPNLPKPEFEMVKLIHVPDSGNTSYARTCSPDEFMQCPRFCKATQLHNPWSSVSAMAGALADQLQGSLSMGASAIAGSIRAYSKFVESSSTAGEAASEAAKQAALTVGDELWDQLTGVGRLTYNAVDKVASGVTLPGADLRNARIENEIFRKHEAGLLLHTLAYQTSIGASGTTSNAAERYRRFVVTMPCPDFNPALELAMRKRWTDVVLRMAQSAWTAGDTDILDHHVTVLGLRGEGRLFLKDGKQATEENTFYKYGAALQVSSQPDDEEPGCHFDWTKCVPAEKCTTPSWHECVPRRSKGPNGWWKVRDPELQAAVAPMLSTGGGDEDMTAFQATYYCGKKKDFPEEGPLPAEKQATKILDCLQDGWKANAELHAKAPWKVFFPEEVVVVVVFEAITQRACTATTKTSLTLNNTVCASNATQEDGLAEHCKDDLQAQGGEYQGMRTGVGFPRGTPHEVVLRPEDILQAVGLLKSSV